MLDFEEIKRISIVDVVSVRYKIALRYRGDYANAPCPLPTHKDGDKGKSFSVNIPGNYWRCFSDSCNANNAGKRGGDVINFVAAMENCREKEAAEKLADWYGVGKDKPAPHIGKRVDATPIESNITRTIPKPSTSRESVKSGYMADVDLWFDVMFKRLDGEPDDVYWKRVKNAVKSRLIDSYRAGKAQVAA